MRANAHALLDAAVALLHGGVDAAPADLLRVCTRRVAREQVRGHGCRGRGGGRGRERGKELADLQQTLKTFSEKFDRDAPTLTESQRAARQKEGAELNRDLQRKQREYQEDLNGRRNEELQQVLEKANKAVRKVADDEKYDLVVQEVVYSNGRHDITDKVLKLLNTSGAK
jgi:outer membrane protein